MAFTKTVSHGLLAFSFLTGLAVIGLSPQPAGTPGAVQAMTAGAGRATHPFGTPMVLQ